MQFNDYQIRAHKTASSEDIDIYSLGLIGEAGSVASALKKFKRDRPSKELVKNDIQEQLGDVLWYLSEIATRHDLTMDDVATSNLQKTEFLFTGNEVDFDGPYPEHEQFPRQLDIKFIDTGTKIELSVKGNQVGNALTDNAYQDDGYRYHDAFHVAYMTVLGWSPVMRALLKLKRKSNSRTDEVEDGARATVLEEGISIMVFSQSAPPIKGPSLFADQTQIPFWLLENIKKMTAKLEVSAKSVPDWQFAITEGFKIFDQLRLNGGGTISCNLDTKQLKFKNLKK